jgi:hypothetical protein
MDIKDFPKPNQNEVVLIGMIAQRLRQKLYYGDLMLLLHDHTRQRLELEVPGIITGSWEHLHEFGTVAKAIQVCLRYFTEERE